MQDKLKIFKQSTLLQETLLTGSPLTVGRHKDVNIQLEDVQLSRFHADVTKDGETYFITDRGSLNGTVLNGERLAPMQPAPLINGSIVSIPPFELHFELAPSPTGTAITLPGVPDPATEKSLPRATDATAQTDQVPVAAAKPVESPAPEVEPNPSASPAPSAIFEKAPEAGLLLTHLIERREEIPIWTKGQTTFVVADIIEETHDVKTFRMVGAQPILFSYLPGQFITLRLEIDGKVIKRSYTISSSPSRPHTVEFTVKRVSGGLVSNWLCDHLKLGDEVEASGPAGKFSCFNYPSQKILCIGAGSGITPVMSMCRWIVDTAADVDVDLLASFHSPADIIFRREFDVMASRHGSCRVSVAVSSAAGPEPWTGLTGRVSADMLKLVCPDIHERHIFMCGPGGFMDAVKECLQQLDFPLSNLHTESFGSGRVAKDVQVDPRDVPKRPSTLPPPAAPDAPAAIPAMADFFKGAGDKPAGDAPPAGVAPAPQPNPAYKIRFAVSDKEITTDGESDLLDLAEVNGIEIDYSCRSGSCRSCLIKCTSGDVNMEDPELENGEQEEGWILPCVAHPRSDLILEA